MKKLIAALLLLCIGISLLCGCANQAKTPDETTEPVFQTQATEEDIAHLESLYQGTTAVHGDTHSHTASTPYSDGRNPISDWKKHMKENYIDFVTIVDHRQVLHMWHEEWDDTIFVGGSEPGLHVVDTDIHSRNNIDYSMIFTKAEGLEAVLKSYPLDYQYIDGRFVSGLMANKTKLAEIIQCIKDNGGMFVYVHPYGREGYYDPVDPMDYWFADGTGFEVCNSLLGDYGDTMNVQAYECWVNLLNNGKRIWAFSGSDSHTLPYLFALVTLYTEQMNSQGYLDQMRTGNLTAGPAGIRMTVGDAVTGSVGSFAGNRVVISVSDFHQMVAREDHKYRLDIYDDKGLVTSQPLDINSTNYFAFDANPDAMYYRANVYDEGEDEIFAVGNPVWNGEK